MKGQLDEQMTDRKAELKEEAGNDPAKKDEIQTKMAEERKDHKEQMIDRSNQEKGNTGESAERDAMKQQLDEQMKDRKAELMEEAGNDPAKKDEIQAKMAEERKAHKEQMIERSNAEKQAKKTGDAAGNDGIQTKTPSTTDGAKADDGVTPSEKNKKAKPVSKDVKTKDTKKAKQGGKKSNE
jgi:hypothetical protein